MQNYKIKTSNPAIAELVLDKAIELGYRRYVNLNTYNNLSQRINSGSLYLYQQGNIEFMPMDRDIYFQNHHFPEISYQDFLAIGEQKQIINQNNMNKEITLKLTKTPRRAKNITVGEEYSGFYVDAEDSEVDSIEEAEYFRCINNNGKESRYSIDLFQPITPAVPPLTYEQVIANLIIDEDSIVCEVNGVSTTIIELGLNNSLPDGSSVSCSCGIVSIDGLNDLYRSVHTHLENSSFEFEYDSNEFAGILFKKLVNASVEGGNDAFSLFSTTFGNPDVCRLMDEICDIIPGSAKTGIIKNNNSGNDIKAWLIARP